MPRKKTVPDESTNLVSDHKDFMPPSSLTGDGLREWKRVCAILISERKLSPCDYSPLEMYCTTYHNLKSISKQVASEIKNGRILLCGKPNPAIIMYNKTCELYFKAAKHFGLTPYSKSGVKPIVTEQIEDPIKRFISKNQEEHIH